MRAPSDEATSIESSPARSPSLATCSIEVYKNGNQVYFLPQGASPNVFLTPTNNVGQPAVAAATVSTAVVPTTTVAP